MSDISMDESIDISRVGILYDKLHSLLEDSSSINLDMSKVEHIDGAGVQLLLAFFKAAKARNMEISLIDVTAAVKNAISTLGLSEELQIS